MIYDCKRSSEKMELIYISFFVARYTLILLGLHDHTFLLLPTYARFSHQERWRRGVLIMQPFTTRGPYSQCTFFDRISPDDIPTNLSFRITEIKLYSFFNFTIYLLIIIRVIKVVEFVSSQYINILEKIGYNLKKYWWPWHPVTKWSWSLYSAEIIANYEHVTKRKDNFRIVHEN